MTHILPLDFISKLTKRELIEFRTPAAESKSKIVWDNQWFGIYTKTDIALTQNGAVCMKCFDKCEIDGWIPDRYHVTIRRVFHSFWQNQGW